MTTRRKPGDGSVRSYETAAGTKWLIVYGVTDPETGKRTQKLRRGFPNEKAAGKELRKLLVDVDKGTYVEPSKTLLRDYLLQEWLPSLQVEPSTAASYAKNCRLHVIPYLGAIPLASLTGTRLSALYRELETSGRKDGKPGGLSYRTVRYVATILHRALKDATEEGRLAANPADRSKPPKAKQAAPPEMKTWDADQLRAFMAWCAKEDDGLQTAWKLLAMTGMRRGEALALRWGDIDLDGATLAVRRSVGVVKTFGNGQEIITGPPKSGKARVIDLDAQTITMLRAHRLARAGISLTLAREDGLVLGRVDGTVWHPERFSREWINRMARMAAMDEPPAPGIRLHDLRHTHATLLLRAGIHPKIVSERLGHAKVAITMDVYSHAVPTLQREAAGKLAELVYGGA